MAEMHDSWRDVVSKAEALGLKLKLHLEQEADDADGSATPGDTRATLEDLGTRLQDAFDSVGAAAKDPAVRSDVKDIGSLLKDALVETFSTVSTEVGDTMKRTAGRGESAAGEPTAEEAAAGDPATDDEAPSA